MGSHPNISISAKNISKIDLAYIAGFLDGDGSIMFQVKKRNDTITGWRFMYTICFYQDNRHAKPLFWIQKKLKIGYIAKRNDGITELRINGYIHCKIILTLLCPYIKFKKPQIQAILKSIAILEHKPVTKLTKREKLLLIDCILDIQKNNYQSRGKKTRNELKKILRLTP